MSHSRRVQKLAKIKSAKKPSKERSLFKSGAGQIVGGIGAIICAALLIYLPALHGGFIWDDDLLVKKNPLLESWAGLCEIWAFGRTADYYPLTSTIFWIEWHIFGTATTGYHVVNLVFHVADSLLLWVVLRRLQIPGAWLAGLIFAVHPVHVESVAWIAELKNVVSMFFGLISVLLFLRVYDGRALRSGIGYASSLFCFILALLAKTQIVFLPVALLLVLWWRDSTRERNMEWRLAKRGKEKESAIPPIVIMTLPFIAAAVLLGLITIAFQNRNIGEEQILLGGPARRLVNAAIAVWWYAGKFLLPIQLMPIYPHWRFDAPRPIEWLPLLGLIVLVAGLWFWRRRGALGAFAAVTCFLIALAPTLGLLKVSYARSGTIVADHYQYFANIFLIALVSAGVGWLWSRWSHRGRLIVGIAAACLVTAMVSYGRMRAGMYRDEETLWSDNLVKNPDAWQAHNRIGQIYFDQSRFSDAMPHFEQAVALKPELSGNHNQLGLVYCRLERFEQGIAEYRTALRLAESNPVASHSASTATVRANLANALTIVANNITEKGAGADPALKQQALNCYREAINQYQEALRLQPRHPGIHRNLGLLLARLGKYPEAIQHLRVVLQIVPNEPTAREVLQTLERESNQRPE